jgi:hypothetical protein
MSHLRSGEADGDAPRTNPPQTNTGLLVVAGILLAIPIVALCWVSSYAKEDPKIGGVPFFFWYQFLWVFITAALTYTAHRLVLAARKPRPGTTGHAPTDGEGAR